MQYVFLLCILVSITGASNVSGWVGNSVQLDIQKKALDFDNLSWTKNNRRIIKYFSDSKRVIQYDLLKGRVEFNKETYSLTVKNLQMTDSGLYEAKASGEVDSVVEEYRLTVFELQPPVLNKETSDNCSIICKGYDLSISTSCSKETCKEKKQTSPGGFTLSLTVRGNSLICNQSNPGSWKKDAIDMESFRLCGGKNATSDLCPGFLWLVLSSVIVIIQHIMAIV